MDTIVLKFGGSSVADNDRLKLVADKVVDIYNQNVNVVVVLSAQGKTTEKLIGEAEELTNNINYRELNSLISIGEQMSCAKLGLLLNSMGYDAISLTGWQAGIYTDSNIKEAKIKTIDTTRIKEELQKRKIVIVTGFQGIDKNLNITTLGRGGSDTTATALASVLDAKKCFIFSDVDGVYTADPNLIENTRKIPKLSYKQMKEISKEGAKVLHKRCVEIGEKYKIPIITKSTFNSNEGTLIANVIEEDGVSSIIKRDISRMAIVGSGFLRNIDIINKIFEFFKRNNIEILELNISENKVIINFKENIDNDILKKIHDSLIVKN